MNLALVLAPESGLPLYRQLAEALKRAIESGQLKPGEPLPSTRELSEALSISRFTVRKSYDDLASQGFVEPAQGSGTYVSLTLPGKVSQLKESGARIAEISPLPLSSYGRSVLETQEKISTTAELYRHLNFGMPTRDQLPLKIWKQLVLKYLRFDHPQTLTYAADPLGFLPLREAICQYIRRARAVNCSAEQIAIFSGSQHALDTLCRILIDEGDHVAMEEPGYPGIRRTFMTQGAIVHPIGVDGDGLIVEELAEVNQPVKLVHTTPSHQDPTAVALSLTRRQELLSWAAKNGALIIEDDNDSEYRYGSNPLPSLQALDENDCVIYVSTFWKTLGPLVVMGFLVLPHRLLNTYVLAKSIVARDFPLSEQCILADFIAEGHLERHIRRTRALYSERRRTLVFELTRHLKDKLEISRETAGMQLVVRFHPAIDDDFILECAEQADLAMVPTRRYYARSAPKGEFLVPFAHMDPEVISRRVQDFAQYFGRGWSSAESSDAEATKA